MVDTNAIIKAAEEAAQAAGGIAGAAKAAEQVPGVSDALHSAVGAAKAKAEAAGMGGIFDMVENVIEQKVQVDLDGDGDKGAPQAPHAA